ncbi:MULTISPECIES: hypothetical protein [unclassified Bacillus (in: firmicutes)]|uniref:hypothetical protein n=1 Tax=unclassified Bacillus (in: firmicutes) TaxID=185979 RepID=UPI000BF197ED|nr:MULTISPECIES: hypothetical protein [unclassified Bacillus (in: firmicutes)]PEJ57213.1 hypothetical protein CN692_13760 [Bacillus sp. AFS002410]PEL12706.1 hypothetical protein CN601_07105 [Bacillus sp. AFS017336]
MKQTKFSSHFTFLSVLFYLAASSIFLIVLYKLISMLLGNGNDLKTYLQIAVVIIVLSITAFRLIRSDIVLIQDDIIIHKGILTLKFKIHDITEIKQLVEVYGKNKELITLLIHINESIQPIILTLENPKAFIRELLKLNSEIKFDEELIVLVNKNN